MGGSGGWWLNAASFALAASAAVGGRLGPAELGPLGAPPPPGPPGTAAVFLRPLITLSKKLLSPALLAPLVLLLAGRSGH